MLPLHETSIRKLKIFCTVVENGGFSAAQVLLNTSAATISVQMKELEGQLGVVLCRRGRSGFALTEQGEAVYEAAQKVLAAFGTFNLEVSNTRKTLAGEIRIGLQPNMSTNPAFRFSEAMQGFHRRDNDVRFRIEETRAAVQEARTLDGKYDLSIGLFTNRLPGLAYHPLMTETIRLYCSATHPLAAMDKVEAQARLGEFAMVSGGLVPAPLAETLRSLPPPRALTESMDASVQLIASGCYAGLLPTHFAAPWEARGLVTPVLREVLETDVEFFLITRKDAQDNLVMDAFVSELLAAHGN